MTSPIRGVGVPRRAGGHADPAPLSTIPHNRCAISRIAVRKIVTHKAERAESSGSENMIEYGHYVGGKQVSGKSGRTADVFQPMDGTVRAHVALASKAEVRAAVE